jgi:hypothetical protein
MVWRVRFEFVGILGLVALRGCGCDARYVNSQTVAYETPIDGLRSRYESRNRFTSFLVVGPSDTGYYFNYATFSRFIGGCLLRFSLLLTTIVKIILTKEQELRTFDPKNNRHDGSPSNTMMVML